MLLGGGRVAVEVLGEALDVGCGARVGELDGIANLLLGALAQLVEVGTLERVALDEGVGRAVDRVV